MADLKNMKAKYRGHDYQEYIVMPEHEGIMFPDKKLSSENVFVSHLDYLKINCVDYRKVSESYWMPKNGCRIGRIRVKES